MTLILYLMHIFGCIFCNNILNINEPKHLAVAVTKEGKVCECSLCTTSTRDTNLLSNLVCFQKQLNPAMRRPSAIVINEQEEVFVKDDICIRVFDMKGAFLRNIGQETFSKPFGRYLLDPFVFLF